MGIIALVTELEVNSTPFFMNCFDDKIAKAMMFGVVLWYGKLVASE